MTYDELCAALVAECEQGCDYVAKISSSYHHERIGTFGECVTYETFNVDLDDNIIWFNDWYEGQDDCYYEKPILINDLIRAYNITRQIKALDGWPEDCYNQILQIFENEGDPI